MEVIYYLSRFVFIVAFLFVFLSVGIRIFINIFLYFSQNSKNRYALAVRKISKYFLKIRWSVLVLFFLFPCTQQVRLMFDKITDYDPCPLERGALVGKWECGAKLLQLDDDGTVYYNGKLAEETDIAHMFWTLECPVLYVKDSNGRLLAKWRFVRFNDKLRICYDFTWEDRAVYNLGFKKIDLKEPK